MSTHVVIPILNHRVTMFRGPAWYLSEDIIIETIRPEDYGIAMGGAPDECQMVGSQAKVMRITNIDPSSVLTRARDECAKTTYVLNNFRRHEPIAMSFGLQFTRRRKLHFDNAIDLGVAPDVLGLRRRPYALAEGVQKSSLADFYRVVSTAAAKQPSVLLALRRFSSGLLRQDPHDRIIDITIALESLIGGRMELQYRFATYNAWAAEASAEDRDAAYKRLKQLYEARSAIVHGTPSDKTAVKLIQQVSDEWDAIVDVASRALAYHVLFLYQNDIDAWYTHQGDLALGRVKRAF